MFLFLINKMRFKSRRNISLECIPISDLKRVAKVFRMKHLSFCMRTFGLYDNRCIHLMKIDCNNTTTRITPNNFLCFWKEKNIVTVVGAILHLVYNELFKIKELRSSGSRNANFKFIITKSYKTKPKI